MPLASGTKRIGITYDPLNNYVTPDVHLLKASSPTSAYELARIIDVLGQGVYAGVIFVGQVPNATYFHDTGGNNLSGYFSTPFTDFNDAYVAALSRFGTPTATNRVLVLATAAITFETASISLCSDFVDIVGIGPNTLNGPANAPIFTSCVASGMTISGIDFISNGAPVLAVSTTETLPNGITFGGCSFTVTGNAPSTPGAQGIFDIRSTLNAPIVLNASTANVGAWPLLYFGPATNPVSALIEVNSSTINILSGATTVFTGLQYVGISLSETEISVSIDQAAIITTGSSSGTTYSSIRGATIENENVGPSISTVLISNSRYNTIDYDRLYSSVSTIVNISGFTDASFGGTLSNSRFLALSLGNLSMSINNLLVKNVLGDLKFNVASIGSTVEFVNVDTLTALTSSADTSALITSTGAVSPKILNCNLTYRLFYTTGTGLFCGSVIGGSSYGITRVASLSNPYRQAILKNHGLLKAVFSTNNIVTDTLYPDLMICGALTNDSTAPILISNVSSAGIVDSESALLTDIPNRYVYMTDCSFTAHDSITQPYFPSVIAAVDPTADKQFWITGGQRMPIENPTARVAGVRTTNYVQQVANRFGPLTLGSTDQTTILEGNAFYVSNPRAFRESLNVDYTTLYSRLVGGTTYLDIVNPKFNPWSVLDMSAEAGLDVKHLGTLAANLPFTYTYTGNQTIRISVPQPVLSVDHLDFVLQAINSAEDSATSTAISSLDVTQAGSAPVSIGATTLQVTFTPSFATTPFVIANLMTPHGAPYVRMQQDPALVTFTGFTVTFDDAITASGYSVVFAAFTTS